MKTRKGFVSNSSSSSFVVAFKGDTNDAQDKILEELKVPKESPLYFVAKQFAEDLSGGEPLTIEWLMKDYGCETKEQLSEDYPNYKRIEGLIKEGYTVLDYTACSDDYEDWVGNLMHGRELLNEVDTGNLKIFER